MKQMTSPVLSPRGGAGKRAGRWWIASAVLLLLAGGLLVTGLQDRTGLPIPVASTAEPAPAGVGRALPPLGETGADPAAVFPLAQRSAPVELRIPAIDVSVPVSELGLNPDETVEVPTDFQKPGWYRLGTAPGQLGSAVILGHVDSFRGPAVFFRLRTLQAGDAVEVTLTDGAVARFAVTEVATYPKDQFPAEQVYGSHGNSALVLVTCGGEFDHEARSYRSNVVAYTTLVGTVAPPAVQN
jgi:LPXTG-site transpeptidase (sortase) family protein